MTDYNELTYHRVIGRYNGIVADSTGPLGDPGRTPDLYTVNMVATIQLRIARAGKFVDRTPELRLTTAVPPRTLLLAPIRANVESGILRLPGEIFFEGVDVVAKSPILALAGNEELIGTVTFGEVTIGGSTYKFDPLSYVVPEVLPVNYLAGRVQVVTLTGGPEGGTWALVYGINPTISLPPTATSIQVQAALRTIVGNNGVTVAGANGGPYTVTFDPAFNPRPYPLGQIDNLTGGTLPGVQVVDNYTPPIIDLTTVTRWLETVP